MSVQPTDGRCRSEVRATGYAGATVTLFRCHRADGHPGTHAAGNLEWGRFGQPADTTTEATR